MISSSHLHRIGKIVKTHGIGGELVAVSDFDNLDSVFQPGACLIFSIDGINVPFFIDSCRRRGENSVLVTIDGIDSAEDATELTGKDIFSESLLAAMSEEDTDDIIYLDDLVGFTACNPDGSTLGTIETIDDQTENTLFIIRKPDGNTLYVPAVEDFIEDIDETRQTIVLDIPDELLTLNP